MCNTESGIRKNFGTESRIAEENGNRDSIDRCSGFGKIVKRSGTAGLLYLGAGRLGREMEGTPSFPLPRFLAVFLGTFFDT